MEGIGGAGASYTVDQGEIDRRFTFHPPKDGQTKKYEAIRSMARDIATRISEMCPDSREKSLAFTNLEQCVMWANA